MTAAYLRAVGLAAPGLPSWRDSIATLRGEQPHVAAALPSHVPALLPVNERRRATPAIRLAFQAAEDAVRDGPAAAASLATVFASSDADLAIIHRISLALTATPRFISPTDFHNSVHNAAAGYWSIGADARVASTTLSAFDGSFAAGLLESCLLVQEDDCDVLLVAFDLPAPEPLRATRDIREPAAVALVLTRQPFPGHESALRLACSMTNDPEHTLADASLESLRCANPATRALPLLQLLARRAPGRIVLPMGSGGNLAVAVEPA
jgi:hypothetical protein